jgi:hypothetical protein
MDNLQNGKMMDPNNMFSDHFLNARSLYLHQFGRLPNVHYMNSLEGEKACAAFREAFAPLIVSEYQYRWYDKRKKAYRFDETVFLLNNNCIVQLDHYCEMLHDGTQPGFIEECSRLLLRFLEKQKREPLEINLVVNSGRGLALQAMEIKRTNLDLDLYYESDFAEVDAVIRKRLNQKNDHGIVLLHGLPGTGKTTYLRYLIGGLKKQVLFLSPEMAGNLMSPQLIELLLENPNTILVIEDAEQVIMDRRSNGASGVSSLLNISDGLLADFLNIQLICTFNSALTVVDQALMRKGRLIASYAFGKLGCEKAQRLSDHMGFNKKIEAPMTLAAIMNQEDKNFETTQVEVIGFRSAMMNN